MRAMLAADRRLMSSATGVLRDRPALRMVLVVAGGAVAALWLVEAVATFAAWAGMTTLHDVAVNTGPIVVVGGGGAAAGAAGGGTGPDPAAAGGGPSTGDGSPAPQPDIWDQLGIRLRRTETEVRQQVELATMRRIDPETGHLETPTQYFERKIEDEERDERASHGNDGAMTR